MSYYNWESILLTKAINKTFKCKAKRSASKQKHSKHEETTPRNTRNK